MFSAKLTILQIEKPFALRFLGHASLCGVLFVAYESGSEVCGDYMLCALFKSHLLIAVPTEGRSSFDIVAIITLSGMQIHQSNEGQGRYMDPLR